MSKETPDKQGDDITVDRYGIEEVYSKLEQVRAIETLEYHNMNHLAFDVSKRNTHKRELLQDALDVLGNYVKKQTYY